jgi:hypothetical protein
MRDLGAPAVLIDGCLRDTPFGPRIIATLDLPPQMGKTALVRHPAYRLVMRDAAGMVAFSRMAAHGASGIDPITASREHEEVLWQVIVLPAGVVLIAGGERSGRTADRSGQPATGLRGGAGRRQRPTSMTSQPV